jgi:hypothetical protein
MDIIGCISGVMKVNRTGNGYGLVAKQIHNIPERHGFYKKISQKLKMQCATLLVTNDL